MRLWPDDSERNERRHPKCRSSIERIQESRRGTFPTFTPLGIVFFMFAFYLLLGTPFPCIVGHLLARQNRCKRSVRRFGAAPFAKPNERVLEGRS